MRPKLQLLPDELVPRVLDEAFHLLRSPGVKVQSAEARHLLAEAGCVVDEAEEVVHIPQQVVEQALASAPRRFLLHDRFGNPVVSFGDDVVAFDPGSSAVHVLEVDTLEHRPSTAADLARIVKVAEMLPQFEIQSTAVVCNEVPKAIGDLYRLYVVLRFSRKPVDTGAFTIPTLQHMIEMLALFAGGREALAAKPQAIFDVCPSPPLIWSEFGAQNLIELARAGVPAEMVSMPLAGAAAPVTLIGAVVQHAVESLSGVVIHQLASPGAPIVWGGAPAIFDMRKGTTPMGAVETAMIDAAYAQVGKALGLPTHAYLGASDAKVVDAQAGLESGITAIIGALAGINKISGMGMLDFLACFSVEKLVLDAEIVGMIQRLLQGVQTPTETLALEMFADFHFKGEFLKQRATRQLFAQEQYLPSPVIERGSARAWQEEGKRDALARARRRVEELLQAYQPPQGLEEPMAELEAFVSRLAHQAGMAELPSL